MSEAPNYITPEGYQRLADEVEFLTRKERPRVVQEVQDAAAQGDRSENAEYIYGKRRLREIDRRLNFLGARIKAAVVVDPRASAGKSQVFFGATVEVEDEAGETQTWQVVGADETDPLVGRVSWRSPLGRALLTRRAGETVRYQKPEGGAVELTILAVRYG